MPDNDDRRRAPPGGVGEDPARTLDGGRVPDAGTPPEQIPMPRPPVVGDARHPPTTQLDQDDAPAGDRGDGGRRHAQALRDVSGVPGGPVDEGVAPGEARTEPAASPVVQPPSQRGKPGTP